MVSFYSTLLRRLGDAVGPNGTRKYFCPDNNYGSGTWPAYW